MTPLRKLIRFHRHQLDEKRRALRLLEEREAAVQQDIQTLDDRVLAEQHLARQSPSGGAAYGGFVRASLDRRASLVQDLHKASEAVLAGHDEVREAFAELKRYEICLEARERRALEERNRREQSAADETAIDRHRRRRDDDGRRRLQSGIGETAQ